MDPATIGLIVKSVEGNVNSSVKSAQNIFGSDKEISRQNFDFTAGPVDLGQVGQTQEDANSTKFNWNSLGGLVPSLTGQANPGSELIRMMRARRQKREAISEAARMNEGASNRAAFVEDRYRRMNDQMRDVTRYLYG